MNLSLSKHSGPNEPACIKLARYRWLCPIQSDRMGFNWTKQAQIGPVLTNADFLMFNWPGLNRTGPIRLPTCPIGPVRKPISTLQIDQ